MPLQEKQVAEKKPEKHRNGGMICPVRPTTKDLAKHAGVSRATVDRVLNGREGVKQKTIIRVNKAIEELGFVRNLSAANLAKNKNYRFAFVLPSSGDLFLREIVRHIQESDRVLVDDMMTIMIERLDENDPHGIASYLSTLNTDTVDGVAIMAPETPQVRDAIARLNERGVQALPFISNQAKSDKGSVGIDNQAAGATAATLLGRFLNGMSGKVLIVSETMKSRDSLERRLGFDRVLNARFPNLHTLPSLETYGSEERARAIISETLKRQDIAAVYILSSEARVPLIVLNELGPPHPIVKIAHERTPYTEKALRQGDLDAVIAQDPGHLARSAIRKLKAMTDQRSTLVSQEKIRVEILLATNL
ncbi:LacI family DNA-binding transcriptional regulator [Roseibium polysiphoniae]|uniref:LacI family DNA-binding transcriptional regulator n=2 Tax=Roseibium polysiphoniae TaxID=2571221 RepID=A0A944CAA8_9HYPH|nr:LacI family DNA-binding transcriptional regulator [Roseibium polysiphoniae]